MTQGQARAVRELERLRVLNGGDFEFQILENPPAPCITASVSVRLGPMDSREGGLKLYEREDFVLYVPPDYPFDAPHLKVPHHRFAGFPHVTWSVWICLYQSKLDWNPADGLYGFFERLSVWLGRAAGNDMDPIEGPLEPPHHITDTGQVPFVIRANAPVLSGQFWFGIAELTKYPNRTELVAWREVEDWPTGRSMALAVVLSEALPPEFPRKGADFFQELYRQGFDRARVIRYLGLAALVTPRGEPVHLVLGVPMRRAPDGSNRLHVAVWSTDAKFAEGMQLIVAEAGDSAAVSSIKQAYGEKLLAYFEAADINWCQVLEDRSEIVVRRDANTPLAWFFGKRVLILGCGALGSWAAEMVARAGSGGVHLVDDGVVKPGLLVRQNFVMDDIGTNKAKALARRLCALVSPERGIEAFDSDANEFILADLSRFVGYDVVLDCTASPAVQMKLERDWGRVEKRTPAILTIATDASAQLGLCVSVPAGALQGPWDASVRLRHRLCTSARRAEYVTGFYDGRISEKLFQPEPGCSEPTFSGSVADSAGIAAAALNWATAHGLVSGKAMGVAFALSGPNRPGFEMPKLGDIREVPVGAYRVRLTETALREIQGWVRQSNRVRSPNDETGGLIWGLWDDTIGVIWVFDASGPPPDSRHDPKHFVCGTEGTVDEHKRRWATSRGTAGFVGFWHTHPDMESVQSDVDLSGMAGLVSAIGCNQKRSLMLIFGRTAARPTIGIYVYESQAVARGADLVVVGEAQVPLTKPGV